MNYKNCLKIMLVFLLGVLSSCTQSPPSLTEIKSQIEQEYPQVHQISTETLTQWLKQKDPPVLLDIREVEEYQVSHLKNAYPVPPNTPIEKVKKLLPKNKNHPIVVYCSVGVRSSQFAEKLQQAGFTQVYNLSGSIFEWANQDKPIYQGQQPVTLVHPYDSHWGKLLLPQHRASLKNPH